MSSTSTPPNSSASSPATAPQPVIQRTITLRVDLRALAALGGALIIVGAMLPWVTPLFAPFSRVISGDSVVGGWPALAIGVLAIIAIFMPRFSVPRVSIPAAALGLVAGLIALASAQNTIGVRQTLIGDQAISPLAGIGLGVYLTFAGSIIAILAGLAPQPSSGAESARAEIRLWQPSSAIIASSFIVLVLGGLIFGFWLGGGGQIGPGGTPTPKSFDTNLLGTPMINVQVNPLATFTPSALEATAAAEQTATPTLLIQVVEPTGTPTAIASATQPSTPPAATNTSLPSPLPTQPQSPIGTPTSTPTPTPTPTSTP